MPRPLVPPHASLAQVYDVATDSWSTALPPAPGPGRDHAVAVAVGNSMFVLGGTVGKVRGYGVANVDTVEVYDAVKNAWATLRPMPATLSSGHVAVVGSRSDLVHPPTHRPPHAAHSQATSIRTQVHIRTCICR